MDRGTWQATVHGVTKSWTRLKRLSMHACSKAETQIKSTSQKKSSLARKGEFIDTNESQASVRSKHTWIQEHEPTLHLSHYTDTTCAHIHLCHDSFLKRPFFSAGPIFSKALSPRSSKMVASSSILAS